MTFRAKIFVVIGLAASLSAARPAAAITLDAYDAAFKSSGGLAGWFDWSWKLTNNAYVGTFIRLDSPGEVQIGVSAKGTAAGGVWPDMDLHVGDRKVNWTVDDGNLETYAATVQLPAGTHLVRAEFTNATAGGADGSRSLSVRRIEFSGSGVQLHNAADDANVNAACSTYIENYRKGDAKVTLLREDGSPVPAGTAVEVKLTSHAFGFGTAASGYGYEGDPTPYLLENSTYREKLRENFNMVTTRNGGAWRFTEFNRDIVTMDWCDQYLDFAEQNNMRARMTNVVCPGTDSDWGQTPDWVEALAADALTGNQTAKAELREEISERIEYYVAQRAGRYADLEVANEACKYSSFQAIYGEAGLAELYNESIDAVRDSGGDARAYFNESVRGFTEGYGDWYRSFVQNIIDAGIAPENRDSLAVGVQNWTRSEGHDIVNIYKTLANLANLELPITLTESGVLASETDLSKRGEILRDNLMAFFGSDFCDGVVLWGFWEEHMYPDSPYLFLYDSDWNLTEAGKVWQQMVGIRDWGINGVPIWNTELLLYTDENGQVDFRGFYGDYQLNACGSSASMSLVAGTTDYTAIVPEPGTGASLTLGLIGLAAYARRKRKLRKKKEALE